MLCLLISRHNRPLSPGGRSQLELCLGAAEEAVRVLGRTCANVAEISSSLATSCDSFVYRGKISSLLDAGATAGAHVALLLDDVLVVCGTRTNTSVADVKASAQRLKGGLQSTRDLLEARAQELQAALTAQPVCADKQVNMQLTQMQKQLASTAALDGSLRAVGTAYAALLALLHKEGAAVTSHFFAQEASAQAAAAQDPAAAAPAQSKVLKLTDCSMKRLKNGDIYRVRG